MLRSIIVILVSLIAVFVSKSLSSEDALVATMFFEINLLPDKQNKTYRAEDIPSSCEAMLQSPEGLEARFCQDQSAIYTWHRQGENIQVIIEPI